MSTATETKPHANPPAKGGLVPYIMAATPTPPPSSTSAPSVPKKSLGCRCPPATDG